MHRDSSLFALIVCLITLPIMAADAGSLYKWTDENGDVHISEYPSSVQEHPQADSKRMPTLLLKGAAASPIKPAPTGAPTTSRSTSTWTSTPPVGELCRASWLSPSFQTIRLGEMISFSLKEYADKEWHLSFHQKDQNVDVYQLFGTLLVKGLSDGDMRGIAKDKSTWSSKMLADFTTKGSLMWLPMVFSDPADVLYQAFPKGPCGIRAKTHFSVDRVDGKKREGFVEPISTHEWAYQYNDELLSPANEKMNISITGSMVFSPRASRLPDDLDVRDCTAIFSSPRTPFKDTRDARLPVATLGEFRRAMLSVMDGRDFRMLKHLEEITNPTMARQQYVAQRTRELLGAGNVDTIRRINFSPDGKKIIFNRSKGALPNMIHVYDLETGDLTAFQPPAGESWSDANYSPDGGNWYL